MEYKTFNSRIACCLVFFLLIIYPRIAMAQYGWQALNYSAGFYQSMYFSDTLNGWLVGYLTVGGNGILRYTSNGGQSWTDQVSPTSADLNKIIFINQIGFCAGDSGVILKTTDAGLHWNLKQSNTKQNLKSIYFYNSQLGWACGGSTIVKTTDGGETWSAQQISGSTSLNDIAFGTTQFGYAVDNWGNNVKTIDGGITWISASFFEPIGSYTFWNVVHFISPTNIILGGYSIVHSSDSGTTWDLCWNGNGSDQMQGITFADRINGWAAGWQTILRTIDGGKSWKAQHWSGSSNPLMAINCVDSNHAWAGGRDVMYHTKNGGKYTIQPPLLSSPTNEATDVSPNLAFSWSPALSASTYHFQVSTDSLFYNLINNDSTLTSTSQEITNLKLSTNYFWRIRAINDGDKSIWSYPWKFSTTSGTIQLVSPANGILNIPLSPQLSWIGAIGATVFHLQFATDSLFNRTIVIDTIITTNNNTFFIGPLSYKIKYYWRICAQYNNVFNTWTDPWSFTIRDKINAPFPMDVGNKWYYVYYSSYHPPNPYGIKKEIIDTTQNGYRTVQVTNYFTTSTTNSIEYLYNTDGKLYQTSSNSISDSDYPLYNAELQGDWGYFWLAFYHPFSKYFFNTSTDAQTMSSGANFLGGGFNESYTTTIKFGVIRHSYYANQASTIIDNDSILLVGMMKNGIIFGDTTLVDYRARTPALSLPPNGYIDIPRTFVFSWNKASEVGSYRLQISKGPQFQTSLQLACTIQRN